MKVTYDYNVNASYIYLKDKKSGEVSETDSFEIPGLISFGSVNFDFNRSGRIIGIEIMAAEQLLTKDILSKEVRILKKEDIFYDKSSNLIEIYLANTNSLVTKSGTFQIEGLLKDGQVYFDFDKEGRIIKMRFFNADKILPRELFQREPPCRRVPNV